MIIYHNRNGSPKTTGNFKNKTNNVKKKYKSIVDRKRRVIQSKASNKVGQKKETEKQKKKISTRNIEFLEGLGLKVNPSQ